MILVSTREFRDKQKKYFELAKNEKVVVRQYNNYINLSAIEEPDDNSFDTL
jgi:hypothetical protein